MISEETRAYYDLKKRNDVRESAKRIRRQFLRYKDAEIIYSLQHKKILELASAAGAIYRMDGTVLINRDIAIDQALDKAKLDAPPSTVKGIDAIRLMSEGYTCREIGEQIGATDKQVAAMVSKARKFLKSRKDVLDLAGNI